MNIRLNLTENKLSAAAIRIELLEKTFMHYHVANTDGPGGTLIDDECHYCGLDLRDPIHRRDTQELSNKVT